MMLGVWIDRKGCVWVGPSGLCEDRNIAEVGAAWKSIPCKVASNASHDDALL